MPSSGSDPELKAGFGPLRGEALAGLGGVDDEAHVPAAADFLDGVLDRELEHHLAPVDLGDRHVDGDLEADGRGGEVVDGDVGADRVLAFVEVLAECPIQWGVTPEEAERWVQEKMVPVFPLGVKKDVTVEPQPAQPFPAFDPERVLAVVGEASETMPRLETAAARAVYRAAIALNKRHRLSDAEFAEAREVLGEQGLVDVVGLCGYYALVSLTLNAFDVPVPDGSRAFE